MNLAQQRIQFELYVKEISSLKVLRKHTDDTSVKTEMTNRILAIHKKIEGLGK